jgi:hypothetical protein
MTKRTWTQQRAARRVRAGDGRPLAPFRWWQLMGRSLFFLSLPADDGPLETYAVDVRQAGDPDDGEVRARLYRNGAQIAVSKLPARFTVPGGHIEVAVGSYGLRRCHYVTADGRERQLTPHPGSAEGWRARLHHRHPVLSRSIGVLSALIILVGVCIAVPQLVETISQAPPIAENLGVFTSPFHLPPALNVTVAVAVFLASTERALRLRSTWLDALAN